MYTVSQKTIHKITFDHNLGKCRPQSRDLGVVVSRNLSPSTHINVQI